MPIAMLSKCAVLHVCGARPAFTFHSVGLRKVVNQPSARCIAPATSNWLISIATIAAAVIGAVVTQSSYAQELALSMKSRATKTLGFLLGIDQILFIISMKKK
jgi:hypothetical protein